MEPSFAELLDRARRLSVARRALLGITGAPGSGKSTLAARLVAAFGDAAVGVPMDGFHLADAQLDRLGRRDRKGAPDTFDVAGYVHLLHRLRQAPGETVYAPEFDRHLEAAVAGAIAVGPKVRLVVTEGNYLLLDGGGWAGVRPLLDEVWFLSPDDADRVDRLVQRHIAHGRTPEQARAWALGTDGDNAALVEGTRGRADVVVLGDLEPSPIPASPSPSPPPAPA